MLRIFPVCFFALIAASRAQVEEQTPEERLVDALFASFSNPNAEQKDLPYSGYIGIDNGEEGYSPLMEINTQRLISLFAEKMNNTSAETSYPVEALMSSDPVQQPEGYTGPGRDGRKPPGRESQPICEVEIFYPRGPFKVAEKKSVENAQFCEEFCSRQSQAVGFISFGGVRGQFKNMCVCYKVPPPQRAGIRTSNALASSYPATVKNYYLKSTRFDHCFFAETVDECQTGCMLNSWAHKRPNAIYSFEGSYGDESTDESSSGYQYDRYRKPGHPSKPERDASPNCRCFREYPRCAFERKSGAQIGTAVNCSYLFGCNHCDTDESKDSSESCRHCPRGRM